MRRTHRIEPLANPPDSRGIKPILISQVLNILMRVLILVRYNLTVVTKPSVFIMLVTAILKICR